MVLIYLWDSKETRLFKNTITIVINYLIKELTDDLITVYLAGSALSSDRRPESDIDLFCVVSSDFDFNKDDRINDYLKENKDISYNGIDVKFHGISLSDFQGRKPRSRITSGNISIPINVLVKQFVHYKRLYGKKIDFGKFQTYGISLGEEMKYRLKWAKFNIDQVRKGKFKGPFGDFIKAILYLCNVDAQINYSYKYNPSFRKLGKYLIKSENHIVHLCLKYRGKGNLTKKEKNNFLQKAGEYIRLVEKKS